jgi:hypothetical protein
MWRIIEKYKYRFRLIKNNRIRVGINTYKMWRKLTLYIIKTIIIFKSV